VCVKLSAQLPHGCSAVVAPPTPPPSFDRYSNRLFRHERRYTKRLIILGSGDSTRWRSTPSFITCSLPRPPLTPIAADIGCRLLGYTAQGSLRRQLETKACYASAARMPMNTVCTSNLRDAVMLRGAYDGDALLLLWGYRPT